MCEETEKSKHRRAVCDLDKVGELRHGVKWLVLKITEVVVVESELRSGSKLYKRVGSRRAKAKQQ